MIVPKKLLYYRDFLFRPIKSEGISNEVANIKSNEVNSSTKSFIEEPVQKEHEWKHEMQVHKCLYTRHNTIQITIWYHQKNNLNLLGIDSSKKIGMTFRFF